MKTITVTQFQASDNSAHATEKECTAHELILKRTSYWIIRSDPDLTEGRGCTKYQYATLVSGYVGDAAMLMEDFCYRTIGRRIAFVQGCSVCENWSLTPLTRDTFVRLAQCEQVINLVSGLDELGAIIKNQVTYRN